jgi:hypothetical protein
MSNLSREFLAERDAKIWALRKGGMAAADIAKRVGTTTRQVNSAVSRQLARLNREAVLSYPEVMRLELERLDALQAAIWPQTQPRLETMPDGTQYMREADPKAIDTVLRIMQSRSKLLGMDTVNIQVAAAVEENPQRAVLHGAVEREVIDVDAHDPAEEAKELVSLMLAAGILTDDDPALRRFAGVLEAAEEDDGDGQS